MKSLERNKDGIWVLEGYDGDKRHISFAGWKMRQINKIYGPGGTGPEPGKYYEERVDLIKQRYEQYLKDNK